MSAHPATQAGGRQGPPPSFPLGHICGTPAALGKLAGFGLPSINLIARHAAGDWGDLDEHDRQANEDALETGARLLSAYEIEGVRFWVITEADRSVTTVLLPEEY